MTTAVTTHHRPPLPPNNRCNIELPLSMKYKTVLRPNIPDVAIIYSANCKVSCEWMTYITNLMKIQGYKYVISQQLESFSSMQGECAIHCLGLTFFDLEAILRIELVTYCTSYR